MFSRFCSLFSFFLVFSGQKLKSIFWVSIFIKVTREPYNRPNNLKNQAGFEKSLSKMGILCWGTYTKYFLVQKLFFCGVLPPPLGGVGGFYMYILPQKTVLSIHIITIRISSIIPIISIINTSISIIKSIIFSSSISTVSFIRICNCICNMNGINNIYVLNTAPPW